MLPKLLKSLCRQDYEGMSATRIIVADAESTDGTVEVALSFQGPAGGRGDTGWTAVGGKERGGSAGYDQVCALYGRGCGAAGAYAAAAGAVEDAEEESAPGDDEYCLQAWRILRRCSCMRGIT